MAKNRLLGPAEVFAHWGVNVVDDERWLEVQRRLIVPGRSVHAAAGEPVAFVDEGRWLADCLECRNGMSITPMLVGARCCLCGATYARVAFPAHWPAVERALLARPVLARSARHLRVEDLERENVARGLKARVDDEDGGQ